ncbi:MAG TPA: hypothetical protein VKA25_04500 [Gemmatimonadales bacterium]|nr:hypothetical protein [Gemmatimonadales bacterium]
MSWPILQFLREFRDWTHFKQDNEHRDVGEAPKRMVLGRELRTY